MVFFVINWKLSPHKIDFSGLHKERRLEKFQNYRPIVLFRVRGPMGSCLCSLVSMNDISSYFISVECNYYMYHTVPRAPLLKETSFPV